MDAQRAADIEPPAKLHRCHVLASTRIGARLYAATRHPGRWLHCAHTVDVSASVASPALATVAPSSGTARQSMAGRPFPTAHAETRDLIPSLGCQPHLPVPALFLSPLFFLSSSSSQRGTERVVTTRRPIPLNPLCQFQINSTHSSYTSPDPSSVTCCRRHGPRCWGLESLCPPLPPPATTYFTIDAYLPGLLLPNQPYK